VVDFHDTGGIKRTHELNQFIVMNRDSSLISLIKKRP
jgi:hypothetical protein